MNLSPRPAGRRLQFCSGSLAVTQSKRVNMPMRKGVIVSSKFDELKNAFERNQLQWKGYEQDCLAFITQVRQELADYWGREVVDVRLMPVSDKFKDSTFR
jgi:hypothetical protein